MVERSKGYSYSDRLRLVLVLGLTNLETRFLRADLIEVFKFGDRLVCLLLSHFAYVFFRSFYLLTRSFCLLVRFVESVVKIKPEEDLSEIKLN